MNDLPKKKGILALLLISLCGSLHAEDQRPQSLAERYSYALGAQLGQALKQQGVRSIDAAMLAAAVDDLMRGRSPRLAPDEMRAAVVEYKEARAQANAEAGRTYLAENGRRSGVVTLPSGLQYEVLQQGNGAQPTETDAVRVHYHGTRIDGVVFDSSTARGEPAEFPLNGVIPGFREAITRMRVGGQWRVVVPGELAYGQRGAGADIGPNETLIFEISLLDIVQ